MQTKPNTKQNKVQLQRNKTANYKKRNCLSLYLELPEIGCDKTDSGIEFHSIGAATKNECRKASIVELTRLNVNECDLVNIWENQLLFSCEG